MPVRASAAVANKVERMPRAIGSGPAGGVTAWAFVRCHLFEGKVSPWVTTMGCKYERRPAWRPNRYGWTDLWQHHRPTLRGCNVFIRSLCLS